MELTPDVLEQFKADLSKAKNYGDLLCPDGSNKKTDQIGSGSHA